jgi:hypothetical protein
MNLARTVGCSKIEVNFDSVEVVPVLMDGYSSSVASAIFDGYSDSVEYFFYVA